MKTKFKEEKTLEVRAFILSREKGKKYYLSQETLRSGDNPKE